MAISNRGELKAAVQDWATDHSTALQNKLDDFVRLAEQRIYYGAGEPLKSEPVRSRDMEQTADVAVTSGVGALPARFLQARRLYWDDDPRRTLRYRAPRQFATDVRVNSSDTPCIFTIEGGSLLVAPTGTGTAKLWFYQRFEYLSDDNDANALLTNTPALHLFATLIEAFNYKRAEGRALDALQRYISAASGLGLTEQRGRLAGPLAPHIDASIA